MKNEKVCPGEKKWVPLLFLILFSREEKKIASYSGVGRVINLPEINNTFLEYVDGKTKSKFIYIN